jgi:hypothetical protein
MKYDVKVGDELFIRDTILIIEKDDLIFYIENYDTLPINEIKTLIPMYGKLIQNE